MAVYSLEPGALIAKDGRPIIVLIPVRSEISDDEADALAIRIVALLNSAEERRS